MLLLRVVSVPAFLFFSSRGSVGFECVLPQQHQFCQWWGLVPLIPYSLSCVREAMEGVVREVQVFRSSV